MAFFSFCRKGARAESFFLSLSQIYKIIINTRYFCIIFLSINNKIQLISLLLNTLINKSKTMKKITYLAILALLFINCKQNTSTEELKKIEKPTDTITAVKIEKTEKKVEEKEDCKDIEVEMGDGRECILTNVNLDKAYQNIIKNKLVEESNYFLNTIPTENKSVAINKDGLISIDYKITKDKVVISMNYGGGNTEVTLEKINNTVKRSIYHYAD
jgi:hypothetical protein